MSTPAYYASQSPASPTPRQPTIPRNTLPERPPGEQRINFAPLAQKYRTEILEGLTAPLRKLEELQKELKDSEGDPLLLDTYTFIVKNMRPLFMPGGKFDYLEIGGKRKNKRKTRRSR
jgi:hypothetical protein